MIGALPFVGMREQQNERWGLFPFGATGHDEFVHHHLGAVDEIAILRFPEHQAAGGGDVVAILEAHRGGLRQWAIVDGEGRARLGEGLQRYVGGSLVSVVVDRQTLAEAPALDVLPRQPDRNAIGQD